jgi:phosphohistidine phosphatase
MTASEVIYPQSAVIPYRKDGDAICILLVSTRSGKHWTIPKGLIENGLLPDESAEIEAIEEAGAYGRIHSPSIGSYAYRKWGGICRVEVFLYEVSHLAAQWPEDRFRKRRWVTLNEARKLFKHKALSQFLQQVQVSGLDI